MNHDTSTDRHSSFITRLDPRTKFVSLLIIGIQLFAVQRAMSLIMAGILLLVAAGNSRLPVSSLIKRLPSIAVFGLFAVCMNMFTTSGHVLFETMGMYATSEGVFRGVALAVRIALLLFAATLFVKTTRIVAMMDGIEVALRPLQMLLGGISQTITIALNFTPLLIQAVRRIKNAQIIRGANPDQNILRQVHFATKAVVPLFAMTLRSSEQLALAMESRCYDPQCKRSMFGELQLSERDWIAMSVVLAQFSLSTLVPV